MMKEQEKQESKSEEVYVDSNLFIYASSEEGIISKNAYEIIKKINDGNLIAYTSTLTMDEVLYIIQKKVGREIAANIIENYIKLNNLNIISVDLEILNKSIEIYKQTNLKPRDSIHLAVMKINKISAMISSDPDFDKIKDVKRIDFSK